MVQKSSIEWTDYTSNPFKFREKDGGRVVWGCVKKSPGCTHCYSEALAKRYGRGGPFTVGEMAKLDPFVDDGELKALLSVRKLPAGAKVFIGDMTDIFGEWVTDEMLDRLFAVFALRPDVVFQVLTKRAERMREYVSATELPAPDRRMRPIHRGSKVLWAAQEMADRGQLPKGMPYPWSEDFANGQPLDWPLSNVWLGISAEDQQRWDERVPQLLATPAAVRFVSYEPSLGEIDAHQHIWKHHETIQRGGVDIAWAEQGDINWVIVGGESGPGARPFDIAWARSMVQQCQAAQVAVFVKQLGTKPVTACAVHGVSCGGHQWPWNENEAQARGREPRPKLKSRKGSDMEEWPADLRVREMPTEVPR